MEILIKVCQVCLACFERLVKFINKNAYIQCAITSHNFCTCCKDAFFLILRNAFLFAIAGSLGTIFIKLGKLFICVATTVALYFAIMNTYTQDDFK